MEFRPGSKAQPELVADRYELTGLLASGGMGEVYEGRDRKLDRGVAIKFLRPEMMAREDLRLRFEAEARAAGRMFEPHVVAVFDTGEHEGRPFIVMELLPGATLADEIAGGEVSEERVRTVGLQILAALGAAHAEGILHRDIKPSNVLITREGSAKVGDFGVAKMVADADLTQVGTMVGTPAYLAPERVGGEPASVASDLYSVGVILYELLAGRKPFEADSALGLIRSIRQDPAPALSERRPGVDPQLVAVVERAMHKDPARRYISAAEMAADLAPVSLEAEVGSTPEAAAAGGIPGAADTQTGPAPIGPAGDKTRTQVVDAEVDPTLVAPQPVDSSPRGRFWRNWTPLQKAGVAGAAVVLALTLLFTPSDLAPPPEEPAVPAAGSGNLDPALEDALRSLEQAVRP